jgi:signal transduction histidine kinase
MGSDSQAFGETGSPLPEQTRAILSGGRLDQPMVDLSTAATREDIESIFAGISASPAQKADGIQRVKGLLIKAQEGERRRLSRELHDGLNQQLAMLTVELSILAQQVPASAPQIIEQLRELQERVLGLSDDLQRMTLELHPAVLEQLGLIPALRSHCAEVNRNEAIRVWFQEAADLPPLSAVTSLCCFRIAQEALRNAARHSKAQNAWLEIGRIRSGVRLRVVDDGIGFNSKAIASGKCLGIISMRERVQLLGGKFYIQSLPGQGTCVEVQVPAGKGGKTNLGRRGNAKGKDFAG